MNSKNDRFFDTSLLVSDANTYHVAVHATGSPSGPPQVLLPGSFNPVHEAHRSMARWAAEKLKKPVWMELSIENVDKSTLDLADIAHRLAQDFSPFGLVITRTPTFLQKARLFPGTIFAVGADTIHRVDDITYYGGSKLRMVETIKQIALLDCRFLVFPRRQSNNGPFLANTALSAELRRICSFVSGDEFDMHVSSSELRRKQANRVERQKEE